MLARCAGWCAGWYAESAVRSRPAVSLPGRAGFFDRVRTGELMNRLSEARAIAHASAGWSR